MDIFEMGMIVVPLSVFMGEPMTVFASTIERRLSREVAITSEILDSAIFISSFHVVFIFGCFVFYEFERGAQQNVQRLPYDEGK